MSTSHWKMWITAKSSEKAFRVLRRALTRMDCQASNISIEPYEKIDGFVIEFVIGLQSTDWNSRVIESIVIGQRVAVAWTLLGSIERSPNAWSNRVLVPGAVSMELWLEDRDDSESMPI